MTGAGVDQQLHCPGHHQRTVWAGEGEGEMGMGRWGQGDGDGEMGTGRWGLGMGRGVGGGDGDGEMRRGWGDGEMRCGGGGNNRTCCQSLAIPIPTAELQRRLPPPGLQRNCTPLDHSAAY